MQIAVLREGHPRERRVAIVPGQVARLQKMGAGVRIESGAGARAGWSDDDYRSAGARVESDPTALLDGAEVVARVRPPQGENEVAALRRGSLLISLFWPGAGPDLVEKIAARGVNVIAMERIPRTTKAQRMDALSSQATAAGYHAALLAAAHLPRFFPMLTTAAGTIRPARVVVLGAGVAGLQAISTARRLGASVQGYDIRAAAAEQVRSLGATFLSEETEGAVTGGEAAGGYARALDQSESERQLAFLGRHLPKADVIISTAQIPGRPAPRLVTRAMVEQMKPGSVVVDLAAETGGNCEVSVPDQTVLVNGVTVLAPTDLPAGVAQHASEMYGANVIALLDHLVREGKLTLDPADDIVNAVLLAHEGKLRMPGGK